MIASLIGFSVKNFSVLPMGFDIALVAQIFLLAGVLIRKYNVVERTGLKTCAGFTLILIGVFVFNERVDMNNRIYGNVPIFYAGGLSGTLCRNFSARENFFVSTLACSQLDKL